MEANQNKNLSVSMGVLETEMGELGPKMQSPRHHVMWDIWRKQGFHLFWRHVIKIPVKQVVFN